MNDDRFEKQLKNILAGHQSEMNLEEEWMALNARRPKRRKRRFFIWLFPIGLGLAALGAWWQIDHYKAMQTIQHSTLAANTNIHLDEKAKLSANGDVCPPTSNISSEQGVLFTIPQANLRKKSKKLSSNYTLKTAKKLALSDGLNSTLEQELVTHQNTSSVLLTPVEQVPAKLALDMKAIPTLAPKVLSIETSPITTPPFELMHVRNASNWAFGTKFSYGLQQRSLQSLNASQDSYIAQRNIQETPLDYWQISLGLRREISKSWFMTGTIGFSSITDRFINQEQRIQTRALEDQITTITTRTDGSEEYTYGTVEAQKQININRTSYQQYQQAFVQFDIGRQFTLSPNTGIQLASGIRTDIQNWNTGRVLSNASGASQNLQALAIKPFGTLGASGQLAFYYRLQDWELQLSANAWKQLTNNYKKEASIKENRLLIGFELGIWRQF